MRTDPGAAWFDVAEVNGGSLDDESTSRAVRIFSGAVSTVVHTIPCRASSDTTPLLLRLHPLLYELLCLANEVTTDDTDGGSNTKGTSAVPVTLAPLLGTGCTTTSPWQCEAIHEVQELPPNSRLIFTCLHHYDEDSRPLPTARQIAIALQGRHVVVSSSSTLVVLSTAAGLITGAVTLVEDYAEPLEDRVVRDDNQAAVTYCIGAPETYALEVAQQQQPPDDPIVSTGCDVQDTTFPGYERLQDSVAQLLQLDDDRAASPSGVVLTGCAGVGKTRLAKAITSRLRQERRRQCHWISLHDLVLQAASDGSSSLLERLSPPPNASLLILDDVEALGEDDDNDNQERQMVRHALVQAMQQQQLPVLAMGRSCPLSLQKAGLLEVCVEMPPPSQVQREAILFSMLVELLRQVPAPPLANGSEVDTASDTARVWSERLAALSPGCVAVDLRTLCANAWNRSEARNNDSFQWNDLLEAARNCVPSQLATLDVIKPQQLHPSTPLSWLDIHNQSWELFCGNASIKKRIYRTVVAPWRRRLAAGSGSNNSKSTISPPSGVLFHGPSGCGKTLAANCLGSSLGLPMIQVRAADVLDKWLGGSEAAIRSIFARARTASPSIVLLDEIDAMAGNRAGQDDETSNDVMSRLLSTLLNEMDGVSSSGAHSSSSILVVACTNRLESLDAALLRPGRLEEHVQLDKPQCDDATRILEHFFARAPMDENLDLASVAKELVENGASAADLEGTCREAVFRAIRRAGPSCESAKDVCVALHDITDAIKAMQL